MSAVGYNGRSMAIKIDDVVVARVRSKTATHARELVDVTADDDDGWRRLLPEPGSRSVNASVEGVLATGNQSLLTEWNGNVHTDVTVEYPDGSTGTAEDGFGLGNLEFTGEQDGYLAFTAEFQSSGEVTITAAT